MESKSELSDSTKKLTDKLLTNKEQLTSLMKELEEEGYQKVIKINSTPLKNENGCDAFLEIIKDGDEKFKQQTGRRMTYGEMRGMYG